MKILKAIKKVLVFGLATLGAIAVIGLFIPDEWVEETEEQTHAVTQDETTEVEYIEEEEEVVEEVVEEESEEEDVDISEFVSMETIASIIEVSMQDQFDYCVVDFDEEMRTINLQVTNDGVATVVLGVQSGVAEMSDWRIITDSIDECSASLNESVKENFNIHDMEITITLMNDTNKERMFYESTNGNVVYDVLADSNI